MKIREAITRDLNREIEEIIKVTQRDEATVRFELTEYVATAKIREQYRALLKAIAEAPADPHEGVGVWISGFFGSGKSAFAKNLGYVLSNPEVMGEPAAELFKRQVDDANISDLVDSITTRFPSEVVMFDVQVDRASGGGGPTSISLYMYRALLRTLEYADDLNIAELEQTLEADGRLEEFIDLFERRHREVFEQDPKRFAQQLEREQWRWAFRRKTSKKLNEASAILHEMDPTNFPAADSWSSAVQPIEVTPGILVEKTFELTSRRRPGKALAFIVDEVGAYVAQSVEKIEDLRAVVEQFGKESMNRLKAKQAVAPVWVVVTSQEKLDEVVEALDSKRVELARLRDRFKYRVDLAPSDIREVATKRVLGKTADGKAELAKLYQEHEGQLNERLKLDSKARRSDLSEETFIQFYPYPPHFIDLSIDIMSGIRLQPGAARHLGGSNRTIIKQAFEMLASERTHLAEAELGRLVTLDLVFELVEGNLSTEKQKDVSDIERDFGGDSWEARVAKALTMLEFVRDVPRSEDNVAAVLYDHVGASSPLNHVRKALDNLVAAEFARRTPEGFKMQTASEKDWSTEKKAIDTRPRDRGEIRREMLKESFGDPKLRVYNHKGLRTFRVGLTVDEIPLEDGQVPLKVVTADAPAETAARREEAQVASRDPGNADSVYWVMTLTPEIDELIGDLNRSRRMVSRYDQLRGQGKINADDETCLAAEKNEASRLRRKLLEKLDGALQAGVGFFRGKSKDGSELGQSLTEVLSSLFAWAVPDLYPKLEDGARPLKGNEAEEILTAAGLNGLSQVFYQGDKGLNLVKKEGDKYVPNTEATTAKEILNHINERHQYGETVTGKDLERRFTGLGYGWDSDLIRLVTAVLLRAGAIEVGYQGRRYRDPQDPMARQALIGKQAFRSATFAPRAVIGLKMLAAAAEAFEEITGQEVDLEEGAIAKAFRSLADSELAELLPAAATAGARNLPGRQVLEDLRVTLEGALASSSDDCVRVLAEDGDALKQALSQARSIREGLNKDNLARIEGARSAVRDLWPQITSRFEGDDPLAERVEHLGELLGSDEVYGRLSEVDAAAREIRQAFEAVYREAHNHRYEACEAALEWIRSQPEWSILVPPELEASEQRERSRQHLGPLYGRRCVRPEPEEGPLEIDESSSRCATCGSSLAVLESDRLAAGQIKEQLWKKLLKKVSPEAAGVRRIKISELWTGSIRTDDDIRDLLSSLETELKEALNKKQTIILE